MAYSRRLYNVSTMAFNLISSSGSGRLVLELHIVFSHAMNSIHAARISNLILQFAYLFTKVLIAPTANHKNCVWKNHRRNLFLWLYPILLKKPCYFGCNNFPSASKADFSFSINSGLHNWQQNIILYHLLRWGCRQEADILNNCCRPHHNGLHLNFVHWEEFLAYWRLLRVSLRSSVIVQRICLFDSGLLNLYSLPCPVAY